MKIIRVDNRNIISLENVRRVRLAVEETNHTRCGKRYTIMHYSIRIMYKNNDVESIDCGEDMTGKEFSETTMEKIFNILEED